MTRTLMSELKFKETWVIPSSCNMSLVSTCKDKLDVPVSLQTPRYPQLNKEVCFTEEKQQAWTAGVQKCKVIIETMTQKKKMKNS